jgi:hypothetical protein
MVLKDGGFTSMQRQTAKGRPVQSSVVGMEIDGQTILYNFVLPGSVINLLILSVQN